MFGGKIKTRSKRRVAVRALLSVALLVVVFSVGFRVGKGVWMWQQPASTGAPQSLSYDSLDKVYQVLRQNFNGSLDSTKLLDGAKAGLVDAAGDPYTEYFNPTEAENFNAQLSNSIDGIGAELSKNGNNIIIMSPLSGYPAAKAGLRAQDIILGVDGKVVTGMSVQGVVGLIRGPVGSSVTLTIVRGSQQFDVKIVRQKISLPEVTYKITGKIGYLQIIQFSDNTDAEATKAAQAFKKAGVKAVILDLRDNPGGYLQGAVDISSLWLEQGKRVVQERRGTQVIDTLYAEGDNLLQGLPTIVLINGGSASAAEITAAALKDNQAATLLGTTSFGKGSVQQLESLGDGSELKVTVAFWYTPAGVNINKKGLKPDTTIPVTEAQIKAGQDPQRTKAEQLLQLKI